MSEGVEFLMRMKRRGGGGNKLSSGRWGRQCYIPRGRTIETSKKTTIDSSYHTDGYPIITIMPAIFHPSEKRGLQRMKRSNIASSIGWERGSLYFEITMDVFVFFLFSGSLAEFFQR